MVPGSVLEDYLDPGSMMEDRADPGSVMEDRGPPHHLDNQPTEHGGSDNPSKNKAQGFVLVHAGAGFHSESKAKEYKTACRKACIKAVAELREGVCALSAVTTALVELENSPITNAGTGSNLNIEGQTECDASVMDGRTLNFAAVGALQGIKNPILVARKILLESEKGKLPAGRVPPCFLVGDGAYKWAMAQGMASSTAAALTTRQSMASFKKNKRKVELAGQLQNPQKRRSSNLTSDIYQPPMDTVGAVILDSCGQVAAAVSSGGLAMKHPGRIGQAAVYGCGCWAERANGTNAFSSASSTSGCGEQLVRTMLARECTCAMQKEDAHQAILETMQNKFIYSPFLTADDSVLGGVIVLRCQESSENCEFRSGSRAFMDRLWWLCSALLSGSSRQQFCTPVALLVHPHASFLLGPVQAWFEACPTCWWSPLIGYWLLESSSIFQNDPPQPMGHYPFWKNQYFSHVRCECAIL
uniref:Taspase, threonine aspartase, 1 n=1 Tax=Eptatretus burgeri TaxID=7764 RepID=A0A8C4NB21_EPTBU